MLINRYLVREVAFTFTAVVAIMAVIFLSHRFAKYLADSVAGDLTSDILFILMGFNLITSLMVLIPIALFFSILLALGRLYKDSEMVVMSACGISQWQILKPILLLGMFLSAVVASLSLYVTPWAIDKIESLIFSSKSISQFTGMHPGQFKLFQAGQRVFYFEEYDKIEKEKMNSVFVYQSGKKNERSHFISAEQGEFVTDKATGGVLLVLSNGFQYQGEAGQADYHVTQFKKNAIRLQKQSASKQDMRSRTLSTQKLWESANSYYQAELQWRVSMPIGTVILVLLAVPLSQTTPRAGRYAKLFVAILIYVGYNNLLGIGRNWIEKKLIPAEIGLWWVHIVFFIAALLLLYKSNNGGFSRVFKFSITRK
jgi:lipopolysaccharide export system permease protein